MKLNKKKIILGMSGGVDSSVCALLLKKAGYEVIGVFMQNWDTYTNNDILGHKKDHENQCNASKDFSDAKKVADILGIKIYKINFIKKYWDEVFKYTIETYKKGLTPNPDILCNKYIKFGSFFDYCTKKFGVNLFAFGHYAWNNKGKLTIPKDKIRDQTYFLSGLNSKQVKATIFPLYKYTKEEVREIAKENNLPVWNRKNSTGVCFIGERKFDDFLKNYIKPKSCKIVDIETKKVIGHNKIGLTYYTIGQNKNLGLGGNNSKYFVCSKDMKKNILFVCSEKQKEKYLSSSSCLIKNFNWIYKAPKNKKVMLRFRHRQELVKGSFEIKKEGVILTYQKTLSITPGQYGVIYQKNICYGGGEITKLLK